MDIESLDNNVKILLAAGAMVIFNIVLVFAGALSLLGLLILPFSPIIAGFVGGKIARNTERSIIAAFIASVVVLMVTIYYAQDVEEIQSSLMSYAIIFFAAMIMYSIGGIAGVSMISDEEDEKYPQHRPPQQEAKYPQQHPQNQQQNQYQQGFGKQNQQYQQGYEQQNQNSQRGIGQQNQQNQHGYYQEDSGSYQDKNRDAGYSRYGRSDEGNREED